MTALLLKKLKTFQSLILTHNVLVFSDANVFSAILILQKTFPSEKWTLKSDTTTIKGVIEIGVSDFIQENLILNNYNPSKYFK